MEPITETSERLFLPFRFGNEIGKGKDDCNLYDSRGVILLDEAGGHTPEQMSFIRHCPEDFRDTANAYIELVAAYWESRKEIDQLKDALSNTRDNAPVRPASEQTTQNPTQTPGEEENAAIAALRLENKELYRQLAAERARNRELEQRNRNLQRYITKTPINPATCGTPTNTSHIKREGDQQ